MTDLPYVAGPWKDSTFPHGPERWEMFLSLEEGWYRPGLAQAIYGFALTIPVIQTARPFVGSAPALGFEVRGDRLDSTYKNQHGIFLHVYAFTDQTAIDVAKQAIADFVSGWMAAEKYYHQDQKDPVK